MTNASLSFGTLNSSLAKDQTQVLIDLLQTASPRLACQVQVIPSPVDDEAREGEPFLAASSGEIEFLENQMLAGEFRLMVVRAPDLVLPLRQGVDILGVPRRATPYDALLTRRGLIIDDMDENAVVGVLNMRSRFQMKALWPHLNFTQLGGGVTAALDVLLRRSEIDALVAPAAVAEHLGLQSIVSEIFNPEQILPSGGQGVLVVLGRKDDQEARELLAEIHSPETAAELEAEHAFLQRFASDQDLPLSVLARCSEGRLTVTGAVATIHAGNIRRVISEGKPTEATALGMAAAEQLLTDETTVISLLEADFPEGLPDDESTETLSEELDPEVLAELERLCDKNEDD